ncbi:MAG: hypothetical protein EOP09_03185, partial [Proteobacteria bacterium]
MAKKIDQNSADSSVQQTEMRIKDQSEADKKDPQQSYDDDLQAYTMSGEGVSDDPSSNEDRGSTLNVDFERGRFNEDFKHYSADFHDRENGAPGIDNDFGIMHRQPPSEQSGTGDILLNSPASG